ncbi:MAG TPA: MBL fold metallo-hydrolase [Gemmatimonadaceae bacterium]|nr:MBL fold metallo-hydrolase [Gemmatimonadaceae bacterium]
MTWLGHSTLLIEVDGVRVLSDPVRSSRAFNLAIHSWSEPAEALLRLGTAAAVPLIMPKPGAPVEAAESNEVDPWCRAISSAAPEPLANRRRWRVR